MPRQWTEEQRAEQSRKIRSALAVKKKRAAYEKGRVVVLTQARTARAPKGKLGTELERAVEALDLVERIRWDRMRKLVALFEG